ncbi:LysR family transcriptional regulator [Defluviimonas sp. WL0024]|uniref:LysR family transcriptional regulator n=1 Tax=Albidovulum salinarum TaxID=2984153 RepID=A0ABT2X869_9RHOB|nr:LysR family transcriptional regulator [Defluviimonas sp. WL0024]MCU9850153.1 LysR family transcriptional regulator [Defluviimonas sp. WL0024]
MTESISKVITLRGLEVFDELARTGSLQETARKLGLSPPAASQQLRNLEAALGVDLVDHARRPLEPTRAGRAYLSHARAALAHLRQGAAELSLMDLRRLRSLRLGIIDDFDGEVTPKLAVALAAMLTPCDLSLRTALSHTILADVAERRIDLGVAARAHDLPEGVVETPLLRDPFVLAVPHGRLPGPPDSIAALGSLPFLRYEKSQIIGRQIATHLARLKLAPQGRIELDSNQALFGLVANGAGWAITTPLGYLRARRFHGQVDLYPLPFAGFSRVISLFHKSDWTDEVSGVIGGTLRGILRRQVVEPGVSALPWLEGGLALLPTEPAPD